ncbi:hypothetical protein JTB14_006685 [Gonioctena quinquepunctata]|nr:hypothetical protein JTB14_006685 [Gonioctena quinquepunctata]
MTSGEDSSDLDDTPLLKSTSELRKHPNIPTSKTPSEGRPWDETSSRTLFEMDRVMFRVLKGLADGDNGDTQGPPSGPTQQKGSFGSPCCN